MKQISVKIAKSHVEKYMKKSSNVTERATRSKLQLWKPVLNKDLRFKLEYKNKDNQKKMQKEKEKKIANPINTKKGYSEYERLKSRRRCG